ncbi:DUF2283 domain-containing protein [Sulfurimonas sp. SAG-AH-194-C21]|nr:DUF2283 domain-containing protein [Sulfurimonas sp. SAG-AH-194-C21]MDF1883576.1 DUF2283 domain-containing protein [Sulfurimonas sp. SAG-AH-194-C21]
MKIVYDNETDSIYVEFSDDKIIESEEVKTDVIVDYNRNDEIVSVEVLNVKNNPHEINIPTILKSA